MALKKLFSLLLLAVPLVVATGCDSNPTNAPTETDIKASDAKRAAAIDADPSMTAEQKASMKSHLGLGGDPSGGTSQKR